MTLMMSTILRELVLIEFMVSTTLLTTAPPLMANSEAEATSVLARTA